MTEPIKITELEKEMFDYLNELRNSGVTNMFGAAPYLVAEFGTDIDVARKTLSKWMKNYNEGGYDHLT